MSATKHSRCDGADEPLPAGAVAGVEAETYAGARRSIVDRDGATVFVGDRVRVLKNPGIDALRSVVARREIWLLEQAFGKTKRVDGIDLLGHALIRVRVSRGIHSGDHTVAIDGAYLRKVKTPPTKK